VFFNYYSGYDEFIIDVFEKLADGVEYKIGS
jgi:hypothetical protein